MQPIINVTHHTKNETHEQWYREMHQAVQTEVQKQRHTRVKLIVKAVFYTLLSIGLYAAIFWSNTLIGLMLAYVGFGFVVLLLGFNFAHDLSHNAIFKSKKRNNFWFEILYGLLGANGYLWKKRHLHSHHHYPNVDEHDADLELGGVIHLSPHQAPKPLHRFQHWYGPLLYASYTLYWIFYKDPVYFFRKKQANLYFEQHAKEEWVKLILFKVLYISYLLVVPMTFTHFGWGAILGAFVLMHVLMSWFLLFTFLITHHVEQTFYPEVKLRINTSWMMHQVESANDFHPFSKVANFIFGGFNCHIAHHLFPNMCHVHYPAASRVIYAHLVAREITPNQTGYFEGIWSHIRLLRRVGNLKHRAIS